MVYAIRTTTYTVTKTKAMLTRLSNSLRRLFVWFVALVGVGAGTGWAVEGIVDIGMVPRLTIVGSIGATHQIQYCTNLNQPQWIVLTNLLVSESPCRFVDMSAPAASRRFYRVTKLSPDGMVLIPAGSFSMGDGSDGNTPSLPVHTVYVSEFFMDRYEVTKALWDTVKAYNGGNGYSYENAGAGKAANHPVHSVNWRDCVKWCNARSQKEGLVPCYYNEAGLTTIYKAGTNAPYAKWAANGYRLPTEVEWEKAARGGVSGHRFPWADTDNISHSRANYWAVVNYPYDLSYPAGDHPTFATGGHPYTSPVGYFEANGYGLYDMAGNVGEWCWDWYSDEYYSSSPGTDPRGPASGWDRVGRVGRGGGWCCDAYVCRTAHRGYGNPPDGRSNLMGFRAVRAAGQ
ncbi:MAG TPA: hypothetical protein DIC50_08705 [Verrucomicrobia subdivision 3 bacterium]|nr:hypothetical protein [Limisphaerales bacterium]